MPTTKLGQFIVSYENSEEYHRLKTEIVTHDCYYFESATPAPLIIDGGAHIGLATLYFKKLYPAATVIALEPHPDSFRLLEKNIADNMLEDVEPLNTALATGDELLTLHEDRTDERWYSTTSIFEGAWNGQQATHPITVPALRLTTLLEQMDQSVDLLKLDIEGAEETVLRESAALLPKIHQIMLEFHPSAHQDLATILELLREAGFTTIEGTHNMQSIDLTKPPHGLLLIHASH